MHGIFYSQEKNNEKSKKTVRNQHGFLLTNASIYNLDSTKLLDSNVENTKDWIRQLRGEYSFLYETDEHIVFGTDQFAQKSLWFFHDQSSKEFDACSVPSPLIVKYAKAWSAQPNKIYIINKNSFEINVEKNTFWNLKQSRKNYDDVFEIFEQSVKIRHVHKDTRYSLSGGIDSGVVHCAAKNLFNHVNTFSETSQLDLEDKYFLKQRLEHGHIFFTDPGQDIVYPTKKEIIKKTIGYDFFPQSDNNAKINYLQKINEGHIMTGLGGDALYGVFIEKSKGRTRTPVNLVFPDDLRLVFPWHQYADRLYVALNQMEYIAVYFRKKIRNPLLDQRLFQAWLNTSVDLKNKRYKDWMKLYMAQSHYPFRKK